MNNFGPPIKPERKILEKDVEAFLISEVRKIGGVIYKWSSQNVRGVPDRVIVLPGGIVVFVEVKRSSKASLTIHQKLFFEKMACLGMVHCYIAYGKSGVNELIEKLKRL